MSARNRGTLLAAVLGVCTAGPGCQSSSNSFADAIASRSRTDAFAMRTGADHPPRRLWSAFGSSRGDTTTVVQSPASPFLIQGATPAATSPIMAPGVPWGPQVPAAQATQPAVMLQPVPRAAPPRDTGVIASSWQPVQHVEPAAAAGPDLGLPGETPRQLVVETAPLGVVAGGSLPNPQLDRPSVVTFNAGQPSTGEPPAAIDALPPPRVVESAPLAPSGMLMPPATAVHAEHPDGYGAPPGYIPAGRSHKAPIVGAPVPKEFRKQALPSYVVEPPDILYIQATTAVTLPEQAVAGQNLVRPDGTISLGIYGTIFVAGMTVEQIKDAVAERLLSMMGDKPKKKFSLDDIKREVDVEVVAFNSKFYYVITDGGGYGAQVYRLPITGNETVLDALAQVNGLPPVASKKKIWVARATPDAVQPKIMPVDWCGLTERGSADTNYQIYPNDRIFVQSSALIRTDSLLSKLLSPVNRVLGTTLLGASTVNTIKSGSGISSGGGGGIR
jgi:polysaccharide export outer membrane protein